MPDFSHLKALAVTRETTREYTFDEIYGDPSVIVSPAVDSNRDFRLGRLGLSFDAPDEEAALAKPKTQSGKPEPEELADEYDANREIDSRLIAQTCIRGWGKNPPVDRTGKPVEFSAENAYEFLAALPDYMIDKFRAFCVNVYNFVPRRGGKPDGEKLGNS